MSNWVQRNLSGDEATTIYPVQLQNLGNARVLSANVEALQCDFPNAFGKMSPPEIRHWLGANLAMLTSRQLIENPAFQILKRSPGEYPELTGMRHPLMGRCTYFCPPDFDDMTFELKGSGASPSFWLQDRPTHDGLQDLTRGFVEYVASRVVDRIANRVGSYGNPHSGWRPAKVYALIEIPVEIFRENRMAPAVIMVREASFRSRCDLVHGTDENITRMLDMEYTLRTFGLSLLSHPLYSVSERGATRYNEDGTMQMFFRADDREHKNSLREFAVQVCGSEELEAYILNIQLNSETAGGPRNIVVDFEHIKSRGDLDGRPAVIPVAEAPLNFGGIVEREALQDVPRRGGADRISELFALADAGKVMEKFYWPRCDSCRSRLPSIGGQVLATYEHLRDSPQELAGEIEQIVNTAIARVDECEVLDEVF
ncbi:hypothetical protein [Luteolibacter soli]|uniref:Uncharacterized protein n=1 Tax=Luteolibacter soli TaxID=3135280 RepID=A0ABU9B3D9_9BACT